MMLQTYEIQISTGRLKDRGRLKDKTKYEFIFENFLDKSFVLLTLKELFKVVTRCEGMPVTYN